MPNFKAPAKQTVVPDPDAVQRVKGSEAYGDAYSTLNNAPILPGVLGRSGVPAQESTNVINQPWHGRRGEYVAQGFSEDIVAADGEPDSYSTILGADGLPYPLGVLPLVSDGAGQLTRIRGSTAGVFVQGPVGEGSGASGAPVLMGGVAYDTANLPPQVNATLSNLKTDLLGRLRVVSGGGDALNASTVAYAASLVVKNAPGTLRILSGYSSRLTPQWIQLFNANALPADGAVPVAILYVYPQQNFTFDFSTVGRAFSTGIVVCNSTTGPTKTIGAADCWFDAQYD